MLEIEQSLSFLEHAGKIKIDFSDFSFLLRKWEIQKNAQIIALRLEPVKLYRKTYFSDTFLVNFV
jgi:hypothetical protein